MAQGLTVDTLLHLQRYMPTVATRSMAPPMTPPRIAICFEELPPDFWWLCDEEGRGIGMEGVGVGV